MKKIASTLILSFISIFSLGFFVLNVYADSETNPGTSISLTPVSRTLQLSSNSTYDESFEVRNDGTAPIKVEVYAAPYSFVYSSEEDLYKLGFTNENNFTQISRWITFADANNNYVEKTIFSIDANQTLKINYRVTTPDNIPAGGQYAVIFAHTIADTAPTSGIRTEASPGLTIFGHSSEGEAITTAEISHLEIEQSDKLTTSAKIKNTGNIDFAATGKLTVEPIIGSGAYGTDDRPTSRLAVIPETELTLTDAWDNAPSFGIYKVTWTVEAANTSESISRIIFLIPTWLIILTITLLTILIIWIIIWIRKRKERRSRLAI